jgi:diacylglycerol kinase family enzyme
MKWLAIINPRAGYRLPERSRHLCREIRRTLDADICWTLYPGHASALVQQYPGYQGYIAVGGDGTIAEVVNALDPERHRLGLIPAGTGNGLVRDLRLFTLSAALEALRRENFERLDLLAVAYRRGRTWSRRWEISTSAVGYVAGATELERLPFKRLGTSYEALSAVVQAFRQREFSARLQIDAGAWQEVTLTTLVVHATQHVGAFCMFPEARLTDGRLDLLYGRLLPRQQLLENLAILTQKQFFQKSIHWQARQVEVELAHPGVLMIDGELCPDVGRIHYHIVPGRLWCCIGTDTNARKPALITT